MAFPSGGMTRKLRKHHGQSWVHPREGGGATYVYVSVDLHPPLSINGDI